MTTIRIIGRGIQAGGTYQPIRHLAGRITKTAPPKNYYAQIQAIYDAITRHLWHYTYDPVGAEFLTTEPRQIYEITLGGGKQDRRGYGDCDDIAQAAGALLHSIGMEVAIATTVRPGSPHIFDHVFLFVKPPHDRDWIPFDPVLYPKKKCGDIVPFERLALWSLDGTLIRKKGPFPSRFDEIMRRYSKRRLDGAFKTLTGAQEKINMQQPTIFDFQDYSGFLDADDALPIHPVSGRVNSAHLPDFQMYGIAGFGAFVDEMGYCSGTAVPNIMAEVDETDFVGNTGLVRTKHFEVDPADYAHIIKTGAPKIGSFAMDDDGQVYTWQPNPDGFGGLFKRLARRVKKRIKRVGKRIKKRATGIARSAKRFAKRIGKTRVFRLGKRVLKTAMKYVKPFLKRYGGKIMQAVAPVAAMIPGAGPFISTALVVGGKAYDIAQKAKVVIDKFGKPLFKSVTQARNFKNALKRAARSMGKAGAKQVLKKFEQKAGIAASGNTMLMTEGSKFRTLHSPGFGWY